ncbi:LOW QUALITY PROTEIN: P2X purinoceptor 7-like [Cariama cristata]
MTSLPTLPHVPANAPERLEAGSREGAAAHAQSGGAPDYCSVDDCLAKTLRELDHRGQQIRVEGNLSKSKSCSMDEESSPYMGTLWEMDEVSTSVCTSVKRVAYTNNRIWGTAEYTIPMQVTNSFFVMTNNIKTENQLEQRCPEYPFGKAICSSDKSCEKGSVDIHSHGIQTGRCVNYNATVKTCEVRAWSVESMEKPSEPAVLRSSKDFTVLIKSNAHFPKFNYTILNIPPDLNTSCIYNKITSPLCPIFYLGDILQEAKENFSVVAVKGGVIAIEINWDCNLNSWFYNCSPMYSFHRLDDKKIKPGFRFRSKMLYEASSMFSELKQRCDELYAKYYKLPHGKEQRTLFKVYDIRFDVLVFGTVMYVSNVDEPHVTLIKKPLKTSLQHAQGSAVEKDNPPPDLLIYHPYRYCAVSNEKPNGVDHCGKSSLQLDEAANAVFFNISWELLLQSHPVKFCDAGSCCTSESDDNHDNEESEPMRTSESNKNQDNEEYELGQPLRQRASSSDCQKCCGCGNCQATQQYHEQLCCRRKKGQCITTSHWFQQLVLSSHTLRKALLYKDPFLDFTDGNINNQLRHLAYKQYIHWHFGSFDLEDSTIIPSCCRWKIRDTYPKAVNNYTVLRWNEDVAQLELTL